MTVGAHLVRYWFEFDGSASPATRFIPWVGVTAWSLEDATTIVASQVFDGAPLPSTQRVVANVDVRDLGPKHVRNQMAPPDRRGIWYPLDYDR